MTLVIGLVALALLWCGERWLPGRPVALAVVALSITAVTLPGRHRFIVNGDRGLHLRLASPVPSMPIWRLRDEEGMAALAMGCTLLAYIEGVAAARAFAAKHRETTDPRRELLGLGVANIAVAAFGGFPRRGAASSASSGGERRRRGEVALVAGVRVADLAQIMSAISSRRC